MKEDFHPTALPQAELLKSCEVKRTRGSGPGGQHRNKVETAIVITHLASGVVGQASERRSQKANLEVAIDRLRVNLALQVRSEVQSTQVPSELWKSRSKSGRVHVSVSHFDFARLLAEAINVISLENFDVAVAAKRLLVSTSQLVKFLKVEPAAFQQINNEREKRELHRFK